MAAYIGTSIIAGILLACLTYDLESLDRADMVLNMDCDTMLQERVATYQKKQAKIKLVAILMVASLFTVGLIALTFTVILMLA